MPIFSGPTKLAFGFGLGVAAAGLAKQILPNFRGMGRPLLKATVKSGLMIARDSRYKIAEFREMLADVAAEAEAELRHSESDPSAMPPRAESPKQKAEVM